MNEKWFALSIEQIEKKLKTNAATGLSVKAARSRCNGKEKPFFKVKRKRWDRLLLDVVSDFFLIILLFVSVFSLFFDGERVIGIGMLVLLLVNIAMTFTFYYRDRRGLDAMSEFFSPTARVIRGGKLYIADYREVVVGDVIMVEQGDIIGCDARIVYSDKLSVIMKLDRKNEKHLEKYASGATYEGEIHAVHAESMSNMLHAGSTVQTGNARAIVVATGEYTYLGSMTGGITELPSQELPEGLAALKRNFSRLGMLLLILTLPFCMFSLLFGHFTGGTIVLSEVISVVLAIGATATLSRTSNAFIGFYVRFIRKLALSDDPCIIRSAVAFDKLSTADYLFILDGSITTDGILHFDSLVTTEGENSDFEFIGQSAVALCDMISLYSMARGSSLNMAENKLNGRIDVAINEFMEKSGADTEALRIRCKIHSFISSFDGSGNDCLRYTDRGEKREMTVSFSAVAIDECTSALFAGRVKDISVEGRLAIKKSFDGYVATGRTPIVFTVDDGVRKCFVGMLVLREGVDETIEAALNALHKNCVKVISFSNCVGRVHVPEIPAALRRGRRAYAGDFLKYGMNVTHEFGSYDEYCGFDADTVTQLAAYVKSQCKCLAVLGFSDFATEAIELADIFITCSPIRTGATGRFGEEIKSLEIPGELSSASCTQTVKATADVLLMRPTDKKGGLEPLVRAIEYCKATCRNLKNYIVYLVYAHVMRIIAIAIPMLFGNSTADARQLIFLSFIVDFFVMIIFMKDTRKYTGDYRSLRNEILLINALDKARADTKLLTCTLVASVLTLLLPAFFDIFSFFGTYIYKAEFTLMTLMMLQLLLAVCIYTGDFRNVKALDRLMRERWSLIGAGVCLAFILLCFLTPLGTLFGIVRNPLPYFLLSFVPVTAFGLCFWIISDKKEKCK